MLKTEISQAQGKPWGVSESGYNVLDVNMNYKYKAFGLKALAVKRMRENDSVVAPVRLSHGSARRSPTQCF